MINQVADKLAGIFSVDEVSAHCDIPCKIYDPTVAQISALSVLRFLDLIEDLDGASGLNVAQQATLSRLVREKEIHAEHVKTEIRILWGDYFKQPHMEQFPQLNGLTHSIMQTASSCKQHVKRENGVKLVEQLNEFAAIFWETKGVATVTAECPYPPSVDVVYPKMG